MFNWKLEIAVLLSLCILCRPSFAQPNNGFGVKVGDYGANRRTRTNRGYGAVSGVFTEPSLMASDALLLGTWPRSTSATKYDATKPTPYVGGGAFIGPVQVDFGLGYDPFSNHGASPGWSILTYVNSPKLQAFHGENHYMPDGSPWRVQRGHLGDCYISYTAEINGTITLRVIPQSTTNLVIHDNINNVFPTAANGRISQATADSMFVKRVTGMTQPKPNPHSKWTVGTATLDNTFFSPCLWREGTVGKWSHDSSGNLVLVFPDPATGPTWPESSIDFSRSGIDAAGKNGYNDWIIDFYNGSDTLDKRDQQGKIPHDPNRYTREPVNIALFREAKAPKGRKVQGAKTGF